MNVEARIEIETAAKKLAKALRKTVQVIERGGGYATVLQGEEVPGDNIIFTAYWPSIL